MQQTPWTVQFPWSLPLTQQLPKLPVGDPPVKFPPLDFPPWKPGRHWPWSQTVLQRLPQGGAGRGPSQLPIDCNTLDYTWLGDPFCHEPAKSTVYLDTLDWSYLGSPFAGQSKIRYLQAAELKGDASLSCTAYMRWYIQAALAGDASLACDIYLRLAAAASLAGDASLSCAVLMRWAIQAALAGDASLSCTLTYGPFIPEGFRKSPTAVTAEAPNGVRWFFSVTNDDPVQFGTSHFITPVYTVYDDLVQFSSTRETAWRWVVNDSGTFSRVPMPLTAATADWIELISLLGRSYVVRLDNSGGLLVTPTADEFRYEDTLYSQSHGGVPYRLDPRFLLNKRV